MKRLEKNLIKVILFFVMLTMIGCSSVSENYNSINNSYNQKNNTAERSIITDTLIASMLYNNPELVSKMSFGKSKTHTKQSISANTLSTTTMESQSFSDGNSHFNMGQSTTRTETRTKTKSKSISTGINVAPNLDYYLK